MLKSFKELNFEDIQENYQDTNYHYYNDRKLTHYYLDDNLFSPIYAPQMNVQKQFFSIVADVYNTKSIDSVNEIIYQRTGSSCKRLISFENGTYGLLSVFCNVNNTGGKIFIPDGTYHYIIHFYEYLEGNIYKQNIELRIDNRPHFYLNYKKGDHVIAAGEIYFKKTNENASEIIEINEHSGCFHSMSHGVDELLRLKMAGIRRAITTVGLPLDKFNFYLDEPKNVPKPPIRKIHSCHVFDVSKTKQSTTLTSREPIKSKP